MCYESNVEVYGVLIQHVTVSRLLLPHLILPNLFVRHQGVIALKGRLKEDFYRLLVEQKAEAVAEEKERLAETADKEKDTLVEEFTKQQEQLGKNAI